MKVWVATYTHRHGTDVSVYASEAAALAARRNVAAEWWQREILDTEPKPADRSEMADRYFEIMSGRGMEFFEIVATEVIQ